MDFQNMPLDLTLSDLESQTYTMVAKCSILVAHGIFIVLMCGVISIMHACLRQLMTSIGQYHLLRVRPYQNKTS